jgi:hypothetical protein
LSSAHAFVQTVPAWISRLTRRLMLMLLVKTPAARPYSVAFARDGVGLGVEDLEGRDRAEHLLLNDVGVDILNLEQGCPVERPGGQRALSRWAAAHHRLGVGQGRLDHAVDPGDVGLGDERAHLGAGIEPVAKAHIFKDAGQARADLAGHPALDQDPRAGHAELPGEGRDGRGDQRNGGVEVGVVEHDHRRLAAELEVHPLEGRGAARGDQPPDRGLPV